jgi:hypothetical protein
MVLEEPPVVTPLAVLHPHVCPCRLYRQGFAFQSATARGLVWRTDCQGPPRSGDRTRSPLAVSQKREYFKHPPETIDDFALRLSKLGDQRRS